MGQMTPTPEEKAAALDAFKQQASNGRLGRQARSLLRMFGQRPRSAPAVNPERRARKAAQLDHRREGRRTAIENGLGARGSERLR